jgi:hypothetical protein
MPHKATIVELPDLKLMVVRAEEFPSGLKTAWDGLESRLSSLKGRKFYGASRYEGSEMVYFAGVVPTGDEEVAALGLPTMTIKGGKYARAKLLDWSKHTDEIGSSAGILPQSIGVASTRPAGAARDLALNGYINPTDAGSRKTQ